MTSPATLRSTTRAVRAGIGSDPRTGAVMPPIVLSATYAFDGFNRPCAYEYSRTRNPTRDQLAETIAALEGGAGAVVTSSGMSAVALVLHLLSPGDRLLAQHDGYGGTYRLLRHYADKGWIDVDFVDYADPAALQEALARRPAWVWIESPSNPLLRIYDLARLAALAHAHGARVAADNTFLSPALQRPLALGADLVIHSTTKYLNGHSDVVGGAVVAKDPALLERLAWWANAVGLTGAPFDSYLTLRGLRTLSARMRVHEENAHAVAAFLAEHPEVARVHYPGLPGHPGNEIAKRQQEGYGGMVSFELHPRIGAVERFVEGLACFTLAESLGGVESLIAHPATMTHAAMDDEARARAGITKELLRLSVGLEDVRDLLDDLERALDRAAEEGADVREVVAAAR
ncbi:MAG TPA: cystathionine gamma-synthase [Thermoanaerobaculia bacterium]|nr:cystathionine gamma-synthase [Thermoanaerobaculia bacterium]